MMYRHIGKRDGTKSKRPILLFLIILFLIAGGAFACHAFIKTKAGSGEKHGFSSQKTTQTGIDKPDSILRKRLSRDEIPYLNHHDIVYRELFNDSNHVQLTAARRGGIDPMKLGDPSKCDDLVRITSNGLYHIDTMYHARPYLTHDAALLLRYVALRFRTLMREHYPELADYRIIVTSALRTEDSERSLRRVNRNATDTSCHMYGTTFDLSAPRYKAENGRDTVVEACKQILALALYELRYEGLCYVKYERGRCFHITVRSTEYLGNAPSSVVRYPVKNPEYVTRPLPKEKPLAKAKPKQDQPKVPPSEPPKKKDKEVSKANNNTKKAPAANNNTKKAKKETSREQPAPPRQETKITDRERISFDNYERRGY